MTYTTATLEISRAAFEEIKGHLERCGYQHAIYEEDGKIGLDMTHVSLVASETYDVPEPPGLRETIAPQDPHQKRSMEITGYDPEFPGMDGHWYSPDAVRDLISQHLEQMVQRKDNAYWERNCVVALLARLAVRFGAVAGIARTDIPDWDPEWHNCVYIDLPTGQVSWHYHDSQKYLFDGLPAYEGGWDGHDTPEKYRRVKEAFRPAAVARSFKEFEALLKALLLEQGKMGVYVANHPIELSKNRNTVEYVSMRDNFNRAYQKLVEYFKGVNSVSE